MYSMSASRRLCPAVSGQACHVRVLLPMTRMFVCVYAPLLMACGAALEAACRPDGVHAGHSHACAGV